MERERRLVRHIFIDGLPQDQDAEKKTEYARKRQEWLEKNTTPFSEGLHFLRDIFDLEIIRQMLIEEYSKMDHTADDMNFVTFDNVFFSEDQAISGPVAAFYPSQNCIRLVP